jgi:UDP-3-O-[3-hydroxymyristoyl] N-acetylglucosamine deacetylase
LNFTRKTLDNSASFEGLGLHSGEPVTVTIHPGERGIWFRSGSHQVQAIPENVTDTTRCTKLGEISTIEHLMSALAGLEITDAEIELTAPELPAMDGSAKPFVEALLTQPLKELGTTQLKDPFSRIFVQETDAKMAISRGSGHWRYTFDTGQRWPGSQVYESTQIEAVYANEVAPARTFGFAEEIPVIIERGLARGLNLETALVIGDTGYNNYALFEDEPARHKLLDAIGDLFLAGVPPRFLNVAAERTGHRANVKAAHLLWQAIR